MRKKVLIATGVVAGVMSISASSAMAASPERVGDPAFVCPVLKLSEQAENSGKFGEFGDTGEYTFAPGTAGTPEGFNGKVPLDATNGDGAGTPGVDHSSPGDTDYTAIWSGE
jgi:hypothetical protein